MPARRLLALLVLVLGGCRDHDPAGRPGLPHDARETAPPPQRIVCGSPAVTEIVFALGCGDRVVGVSDFSTFPPDAEGKTRIGGWINPNRERLLVLKPDIIVTQGAHETLAAFARKYGIRFHAVELDTLEEIRSGMESIATAVGVPRKGRDLSARVQRDINLAALFSERLLLLVDGKIHADGSPRDVVRTEVLQEAYGEDILVQTHPETGGPMILPRRESLAERSGCHA